MSRWGSRVTYEAFAQRFKAEIEESRRNSPIRPLLDKAIADRRQRFANCRCPKLIVILSVIVCKQCGRQHGRLRP